MLFFILGYWLTTCGWKLGFTKRSHSGSHLQSFSHQTIVLRRQLMSTHVGWCPAHHFTLCYFVLKQNAAQQIKKETTVLPYFPEKSRNIQSYTSATNNQTTGFNISPQTTKQQKNNHKTFLHLQVISHQWFSSMFVRFFVERFLPLSLVGAQNWPACQDLNRVELCCKFCWFHIWRWCQNCLGLVCLKSASVHLQRNIWSNLGSNL